MMEILPCRVRPLRQLVNSFPPTITNPFSSSALYTSIHSEPVPMVTVDLFSRRHVAEQAEIKHDTILRLLPGAWVKHPAPDGEKLVLALREPSGWLRLSCSRFNIATAWLSYRVSPRRPMHAGIIPHDSAEPSDFLFSYNSFFSMMFIFPLSE